MNEGVLYFTPSAELDASANLNAFVELCRRSKVLGGDQQFSNNIWDVGYFKGKNVVHRVIFSTMEAAAEDLCDPVMPQPFLDFAKAILIYLQSSRPAQSQSLRISSLRYLEAALRELNKGSRPTAINDEVLDTAIELAKARVSAAVTYRIGGQLRLISEVMCSKGFILLRQAWKHGLKRPNEPGSRISKEAISARQEKLPSASVLRGIGVIFQEATDPRDVLVSSYLALLLCAPERINEVLRLTRNCLVEGEGRYVGKLGIRWPGSKGASDTVKWLPTEMVPIARAAISNLLRVTDPAHQLADWYATHPTKIYLHPAAEYLRGRKVLSPDEIGLILWGKTDAPHTAKKWVQQTAKLPEVLLEGGVKGYLFDDVERAVVGMLPATFPYALGAPNLLCKDALAVFRRQEMHSEKITYLCMFTCVDQGAITNPLGRKGRISIFECFGLTEDDGSPIVLTSHSLRHYLNMLAQMGGLSNAEISIFSGRKDPRHNSNYDHLTSDEVQAPINRAIKHGFTVNLVPARSRDLITRNEFKGMGVLAAHTTDYGWCEHNFASEPCQMHRDCINCPEDVCIKGEEHKEANLRRTKDEVSYLLQVARDALSEEEFGADIWVRHQTKTLERVNELLSILDDPEVPAGAEIRLAVETPSLITSDKVPSPKRVVNTFERKRIR